MKKNTLFYAQRALQLLDLTSLNDTDSVQTTLALCQRAHTPFGNCAAICIFPQFLPIAANYLKQHAPAIRIATVVNFPTGTENIDMAVNQTRSAIEAGCNEIDLVFPYQALQAGNSEIGLQLVAACKEVCPPQVLLKVIIESGVLTATLIKQSTEIAITAGADFIKTSTGKLSVNATLEAAQIILQTIKKLGVSAEVGFKASGGIQRIAQAVPYLQLAESIFGDAYLSPRYFRFGASQLLFELSQFLQPAGEQ